MNDFSITKVFEDLLKDEVFKTKYYILFLDRFVYSTTDLEKETNEERKKSIERLLDAFNILLAVEGKLSPFDFVDAADFVNKEQGISGLRKINVSAGELAIWKPVPPNQILYSLYSLLDCYYNIWVDREVYEKEAAFHIEFMRIHPFEDGNKRIGKLIMNSNLVKQNYPPVIISEGEVELYYDFINREDVEGFAKFLRTKSLEELGNLMSYYKLMHDIPITESVVQDVIPKEKNR